jgi:hypothetical protein
MMCSHLFAVLLACLPLSVQAEGTIPEAQNTILAQIEAMKVDDFATAFTYASPAIKGIFGTPENFGMMVRQGYPMVWKPSAVQMLEQREIAGALWQKVLVTDGAGQSFVLDYQMVETAEGWQINAVQLLPSAGVGA